MLRTNNAYRSGRFGIYVPTCVTQLHALENFHKLQNYCISTVCIWVYAIVG